MHPVHSDVPLSKGTSSFTPFIWSDLWCIRIYIKVIFKYPRWRVYLVASNVSRGRKDLEWHGCIGMYRSSSNSPTKLNLLPSSRPLKLQMRTYMCMSCSALKNRACSRCQLSCHCYELLGRHAFYPGFSNNSITPNTSGVTLSSKSCKQNIASI